MKSRRIGVVLLLAALLWSSGAVAAESTDSLSWKTAFEAALSEDAQYQMAQLRWNNAEIDHRISEIRGHMTEQDQLEGRLSVITEESSINDARTDLYSGMVSDYAALMAGQWRRDALANSLAAEEYEENITRRRVELGDLPEQDLIRQQQSTSQAREEYERHVRQWERDLEDFKRLVPDMDRLASLSEFLIPFPFSLEQVLESAHTRSPDLKMNAIERRLAEIAWDRNQIRLSAPLELEKAHNQFRISLLSLEQRETNVLRGLEQSWYDVQDRFLNMERAATNVELAHDALDRTQRQFSLGLIPEVDLWDAQNNYSNTYAIWLERQASYITAGMNLMTSLGLPAWPWEDFQ